MAKVTSFKDRIIDLVGSLGTADDDAIEQWILDGCYDVISRAKAFANPIDFSIQSSGISSGTIVALDTIRDFISVERDSVPCQSVSPNKRHLYTLTDSIYEATENDPVYYKNNGIIYVKPNPTSTAKAYYTYIPEYSITSFTSTSSIDNFPKEYYDHIILFAAIMVASRRMQDLMDDTSVNTMYSLDNLRDFFDNDKPTSTTDLFALLAEEDIDMITGTLSVSDAAGKLISLKYNWLKEKIDFLMGQYMGKFPQAQGGK